MKELIDRIATSLPPMHGWCPIAKANAMAKAIIETRPETIVEIGVFGGRSLLAMAFACQSIHHGKVYGVDPWSAESALDSMDSSKDRDWWGKIDYENIYASCLKAILDHNAHSVCSVFRTTSERAASLFDKVDMLHIDGNHSEKAATLDVTLWLPKVPSNGLIWLDDIEDGHLFNAIGLLNAQCDRLSDIGTCGVFKKR